MKGSRSGKTIISSLRQSLSYIQVAFYTFLDSQFDLENCSCSECDRMTLSLGHFIEDMASENKTKPKAVFDFW